MGKFISVLSAYILLCFGIQYFREPREVGPGPLVSSYIFMFAAFLLLWDMILYPKSLRKLGFICQCIVEFFIASFLLENIMVDFWFPLELVVLSAAPKLADLLEEMLQTAGDWPCDGVCDVLRNEMTALVSSYILSIFYLLAVLHATRAIDLRELANGPGAFFGDIICRIKRFFRNLKKYFGIGIKKKVHIKSRETICPGMMRPKEVRRKSNDRNSNGKHNSSKRRSPCDDDLKYSFSDFEMGLQENDD